MRRLWGRVSSINVQKPLWTLDELGLPYERIDAGQAFGIVDTPAFRALNPNGRIPVLEEDGFVLWESNAISRYLAATHPEAGLWPENPRVRADADRWMDWQTTTATPALRDAFWQIVRTPADKRDDAVIATSVAASAGTARILDQRLTDRPYLAGDAFTLADLVCGCHVKRWRDLPIDRPRLPALEAWFARIAERPGARQVMAITLA